MSTVAAEAGRRSPRVALIAPSLPGPVWVLQAGMFVNSLGTGLLMPFLVIYLHDVRGFPLATAGAIFGMFGASGIVAALGGGSLVDRLGARAVFLGSLSLLAGSYALFTLIERPWQGFLFMGLAGIGNGAFWPSQSALLIAATPPERRHAAFGLNRMTVNLGLGIGAAAGGIVITTAQLDGFRLLFFLDAATFLALALAGLAVRRPAPCAEERRGSYRDVLGDRTFMAFVLLNTAFVTAGYAQLEAGLPVFAKHEAGLSEAAIGAIFLANVVTVVLVQLPAVRLLEGRRRMRALGLMSVLWAAAWALVGLTEVWGAALVSAVSITLAVIVFALGECLHGPLSATIAADLAPEPLRGRYMALSTNSYAVGFALGPLAAGLVLGLAPALLFPLAALTCLAGGGCALTLERFLPPAVRVTPSR